MKRRRERERDGRGLIEYFTFASEKRQVEEKGRRHKKD